MSINLLRNSKVYFTTNVEATAPNIGKIKPNGFTVGLGTPSTANTWEIQVLDDLSFSQTTAVETIGVNETGLAPIRGQRTFNTALNPVDFNFTTYMRPFDFNGIIQCEEQVLWNAMFATDPIGGTSPAWANGTGMTPVAATALVPGTVYQIFTVGTTDFTTAGAPDNNVGTTFTATGVATGTGTAGSVITATDPAVCRLISSNSHQLQRFGIIVVFDQNMFLLDDCSLNTATIDFGIDAIASIQWSGQARAIRRLAAPTDTSGTWTGTLDGTYIPKITQAPFIANKLSTVELVSKIGAYGAGPSYNGAPSGTGTTYKMPLTGGSITLTNNITYLTPAYMGAINQPITYFTGSRSITGSLSAYLRTGTGGDKYSADLFSDLLNQVNTDSDPEFYLQIQIGGGAPVRVELEMPGVVLTIPTVNAESVITTTVNFTAQGTDSNKFDILKNNEIMIKYFA